ncbi:MAG TPA: aspartate/glutamate racemase family protein [Clostridia bacterium]|nr:aspartate/glutamate racemase family protein [Clostridia bacterium]
MKTIGLIGGMSWESTVTYYQLLNEGVKDALGGLHSAKVLLYSVDFFEIESLMSRGDWDKAADLLGGVAARLENAGADMILICTNTLHKVAPQVQSRIRVPLVHIAVAAAEALTAQGISRVGLLGTKYTMTQAFYRDKLVERGIEVLIPEGDDIDLVNRVIFDELCLGIVKEESRTEYLRVIADLQQRGAQGILLGCTELGLIVAREDVSLPLFDTTEIHAKKALALALTE